MTIAELERAIESKKRVRDMESKDKAIYDYILAQLVGNSIARMYGSNNSYPTLSEAYPGLFEEERKATEEEQIARMDELSALRFIQFVSAHNKTINE